MTVLDHALDANKYGFRVFPLRGKVPCTPHGFKDASDDPATIRALFEAHPDATGYGIATGKGLLVVDFDPRHGSNESRAALEAARGAFPATIEVATGNGGTHLYYQTPRAVKCSAGKVALGIDTKGDGGCIVGPGSIHPTTGKPYTWQVSPEQAHGIAGAPQWLLDALEDPKNPPATADTTGAKINEGGRNQFLIERAGVLRHADFSPDALSAALSAENQSRCNPPLPDVEVQAIVQSVLRYAPGKTDSPPPDPVNAARWITTTPPPVDAIIEGLFDRGDKVPIIGSSKARKTFFALQ
jgi:putative DNA primase/helicase